MVICLQLSDRLERTLWSIAFPGFGQLLNGQLAKGALFILLEFVINTKSGLNRAIMTSFYGNTVSAAGGVDYSWLLFYPCVYLFSAWDAYKNAGAAPPAFSFMPFVLSAYLATIGVIYSPSVKVLGFLPGPIWLPILSILLGTVLGIALKKLLCRIVKPGKRNGNQPAFADENQAVLIIDKNGRYTYLHDRVHDLVYQAENLEMHGDSLVHTRYFDYSGKELSREEMPGTRALRGEKLENMILKAIRPDKTAYYNFNATPVYNKNGEITSAILLLQDVTQQLRTGLAAFP